MEDWRSSNCVTNGLEHYSNYNGRSSWSGRTNRSHYRSSSKSCSRPNSRRGSKDFIPTEFLAKSNNQKSKPGNKRPAQSKMRLETNNSRNAEPETPAVEVSPPAPPVPETKTPVNPAAVIHEQSEKSQEETSTGEAEEKEKENVIIATKNEENNKQTSVNSSDGAEAPAVSNKVVLKHNYESGQWSPLNPDGKKKYDRQFIMNLKNGPQSKKLNNFPYLELLSDNNKQRPFDRNVINSMNRSHSDLINPFKNSSQRGGQTITKRSSQQGKPKPAKPTVIHVSLPQDVKLHETENAWKPTRITEPNNTTEEEAKTEALYKRVRGILNKLTPEKLDTLVAQVQELPIDNSTRLRGVIDLVFKKAVDEPSFSVAYAQMCKTLQKIEVPSDTTRSDGKPDTDKNFRKLLINRCQEEFEKNTAEELRRDDRLKEIEQEKDPEKKKMLQLSFEEEERRIRMRSVGNIRFIGELYKLQMLACKIMHNCVKQLLHQGDEESLECLCKLLTTIGQDLESKARSNKEWSQDFNSYFKNLNDIVKNKGSGKVSSRVRFMIQDLIDLRDNKWVPRRNEAQPKTIDQIQKEVERENMEMNYSLNSPQERNKRQDSRNSLDNRKRGPDSSGWTTVSSQQNKSRLVVESSKLKLEQSDVEIASNVSLGSRTQFMWSQGASSNKMDNKRPMSQLGSNKFAVLCGPSFGNSNLKGSSLEKDKINSYKVSEENRSSKNNRSQPDPNSRSSSRESASSKRDENRFITTPNEVQTPPPPTNVSNDTSEVDEATEEEVMKKAKSLLEDYLICEDVNEASDDLKEKFTPSTMKNFVYSICLKSMDMKGPAPKRAVGVLMSHFIKKKEITLEQFQAGLSMVLEIADDLAIDMPYVWDYLAEILVDMLIEEVITFKDIASSITPIRGSPGSAKFFTALVKLLLQNKKPAWLENQWALSEVSLVDIIGQEEINNFVKQNKVEFMLGGLSMDAIKSELGRMIKAEASFDKITSWITANVGEKRSAEPLFVRTLMTVLLEACVTKGQLQSYKFDKELLSRYEQLIVRYTNHLEKLELPCLFAIQAFVHKLEHPQAILHNLFNHLWDGCLIAAESFKAWRHSTNPQEYEGHAVCVKSLTSFFTHLNETDSDENES